MVDHRLLKDHDYALVSAEHLLALPEGIPCQRLTSQNFVNSDSLLPSLITLRELSEAQSIGLLEIMQSQIEQGHAPVITGLFKTDNTPEQVKAYFSRHQVCTNLKGETAWLRLHDPRVWVHLQRVLGDDLFASLIHRIPHWTFFLCGEWRMWEYARVESLPMIYSYLSVDAAQWEDLQRIGLVNRCLRCLGLETFDEITRYSPGIQHQITHAQLKYQLTRAEDIVRYVHLAVQIHPQFDDHPVMREAHLRYQKLASQSKIDEDESVVDAFNEIPSSQWPVIRAELNQTQPIAA